MDLSKTTLQELEISKTDKLINEKSKQENHDSYVSLTNHKSIEVESNESKQNVIHLNYKQLKTIEMQQFQTENANATIRNIETTSSNVNVLPNWKVNQNWNTNNLSNLDGELNKTSVTYSKLNLCDKEITVNEINNANILKPSNVSTFLEDTEKNVEDRIGLQKEMKNVKVIDEVETIEKIAEMIAITSKDTDKGNAKTKKPLQSCMPVNLPLQSCNNFCDNSACDNYNETNIRSVNLDNADQKIINEQRYKKRKCVTDPDPKIIDDLKTGIPIIKNNEICDKQFSEKSRFEEIEDKLEEMFAGIEDEQLVNMTSDDKNKLIKKDYTDEYLKVNGNDNNANHNKKLLVDSCLKHDTATINTSLLPTKAAKKSTTVTENTNQLNLLYRDHKNSSIPKSMFYLKTMPTRRRLSIGMNKELLKLSIKSNERNDNKTITNEVVEEEDITPPPLSLQARTNDKQTGRNGLKNKIKNNNQRKCSKYKKEITYIKSNNSSNKKIIRKPETPVKAKSPLKIKQQQMHRLLYSENEIEEKQLQTRDIETKNRSPFILIKNNGIIAVVNTVTPDDSNEKYTRSKKTCNYAYERKTVKGCHSSTLSNRYNADIADSSWKCVFCKIGPHKKGLGDLFGPYIISSDCDEYRSNKDYFEKFQKYRRNDTQPLNFSNKSIKYMNESSNSHIRNISECNYEHLINIYALGMSQVAVDCYEIWVHEDCAVWAPNIFVVGSRLAGLESATWNSIRYDCEYCSKQGALLCCLQRDCKTISHVPCAREFNWLLDESKFWVYCSKHALDKIINKN